MSQKSWGLLPTFKDHSTACTRPRTSCSLHIPMPAPWKSHLCNLLGTSAATTPKPPAPITSDIASGWGWSLLRLLPPPLGSPLSGSLKQGGNGPEPREADVGWGGPAPRSPQIPTWLQHKQPSSPTRSLPGDLDKQLMRQRDHRGLSKSHSNLAWLYFYALISTPSQVGKK